MSPEIEPSAASQVAPGKACGTCMMCCKLPLIKELDKPVDRWCRHAVVGKGCGIYADRPASCRSFHCQWIRDAQLGPEWKPEKARFILYPDREKEEVFNVAVDPAYPDAWTKPPFFAAIKNWVQQGADLGRYVMVRIGSRWLAVLPDRVLELGHFEEDFVLERARGPTGRTIELRVKPPSPGTPTAAPVQAESKSQPDHVEAHFNRGNALQDLKRPAEALASFEAALAIKPDHVGALNNRGLALAGLQRPADALMSFEQVLAIQPDHVRALNNRGNALQELRRPAEALASYEKALVVQPAYAEAHYNRGIVLRALGRPAEALASFDSALAIDPNHVDALNNRGIVLRDLDRPLEALASYDRALAIEPGYAEAHSNRSCLALLLGDYARGFEEFEWRWRVPEIAPWRRDFAQPLWRGDAPLAGKTILLHAEQGFGDAIQFVRYVPLVAARGATVVLEAPPPLAALLARVEGAARVIGRGDELPAFDCHCPLASLPLAFNTRLETIPARVPYLSPAQERVAKWQQLLPETGRRRVGIAWAGNANFRGDQSRSIGLARFSPLLAVPDIALVGLQRDLRDGDRGILRDHPQVVHLGDAIADFDDTAAIMSSLDLVISSDTSVAHLAGALGKPVWLLLQYVADWRWLRERSDNPWYPTARLFRQPELDDWESVVRCVADALRQA